MNTGRLSLALNEFENAHGTEIDAGSASVAENAVDKYIHEDGWRRSDLHINPLP
jgi:hypothetical protein